MPPNQMGSEWGEGATEWHAKREDHYGLRAMQIICAAASELLDAPRDPLFEIVPPPAAPVPPEP